MDLPIRYKLLVSFSAVCIAAISLGSLASYALMRNTIEARIESELTNITEAILNMVKTGAAVSIKNRLQGRGRKKPGDRGLFLRAVQGRAPDRSRGPVPRRGGAC